jgi:hypothetical protein
MHCIGIGEEEEGGEIKVEEKGRRKIETQSGKRQTKKSGILKRGRNERRGRYRDRQTDR